MGEKYQILRVFYEFSHNFVLITLELSEVQLNSNLGAMHLSEKPVGESLPSGLGISYFQVRSELRL